MNQEISSILPHDGKAYSNKNKLSGIQLSTISEPKKAEYDAIIVGAGLGGLTCGALLAKNGLNVLVAEQHSRPGGYCTSFKRQGFTFDAGFDTTLECEKGGVIYNILEYLGLIDEIRFIRLASSTRIIGNNYDVRVTTMESLGEDLKRLCPHESKGVDIFLADCKALATEMKALSESSPDLLGLSGKLGLLAKFILKSPHLRKYNNISTGEVLNTLFREPKVKAILGTLLPFDPKAMATLLMMILGGKTTGYYPEGGAQSLADTFAFGVIKYGGDLVLNTMVRQILVQGNRATGVQLTNGNIIRARFIISNADGRETFMKLIGKQYLDPRFVKEISETALSESHVLVSLGVDLDLRAMGFDGTSIIYNRCNGLDKIFGTELDNCYLSIKMHSLRDSSQAPKNLATVQLLTCLPYEYKDNWQIKERKQEYLQLKEAVAEKLIVSAESVIPGLKKHVIIRDIATPLTFERYTLNSHGASMGWFPAPSSKMRSQRTPIKNLFQGGAWTFPGASVYAVVQSGRNAADLVLKTAMAQ